MKLSAATLFLLSSSLGIVAGTLPPGFEDDAYCPKGNCLVYTNTGLRGPKSAFYKCLDQSTAKITKAVWTGSKTDVVPPPGWAIPQNCDDVADGTTMNPANQQKFADKLTSSLYSKPNECSSSLSVSMVFSLLYPGATNDGITELRDTFGYPDGSNMQLVWQNTTERMLESANHVVWEEKNSLRERTHLKFANSVWLDIGAELNEDYEEVVGDYVLQTDFESSNSSTAVNSWVKENTNGLIDAIVPPDEPLSPAKLLAINSIYLKARWLGDLFEAYNTNLDTFYASPSRSTKVSEAHFMHTVDDFFYSHDALKGYQTIKLPLLMGGSMSMIFVLPQTDGGKAVKSMDLIDALDSLESRNVALALPKFNFKSTYEDDLMEALIALGLDSLFTDSDSLCGLLEDSECLSISKVIQKTSITVDEEGVEAAAATAVTLNGMAMPSRELPISMMLDHPFQFFIYDEEEKLMLFEGRLGAPEVPKEEPSTPLLDAKHSDADFWVSHFGRQVAEAPVPSASSPPLQYW